MESEYCVRVQYGEYEKTVMVRCDNNTEVETIKALARRAFLRDFGPPLAMCSESQRIIGHTDFE
jgi:hypothetical protein